MHSNRLNDVATAAVMDHLIRRECARTDRNGQAFSLVLFRVNGHGRQRALAAHRLAHTMLKRARLTDDVGWVGDQHLAALLPDTSPQGARAFADKVADALARHSHRPLTTVYAYPRDHAAMSLSTEMKNPSGFSMKSPIGEKTLRMNFKGYSVEYPTRQPAGVVSSGGAAHALAPVMQAETQEAAPQMAMAQEFEPAVQIAPPVAAPLVSGASASAVQNIEDLLTSPTPFWKRVLDVVVASIALVLLSPVFAAAALAIKLSSPGPVMFFQRRSGLGGKPFTIYKFRTMVVDAEKRQQELRKLNEQDGPAFKLTRDPRVTRVGAFLRKTSIDELPQLVNVIKGDMSLVGPRPLPIKEQDGCMQWQRHRLNVAPGLTCIWQVKGRSEVSFADWVRMDVEYIRRRTIFHDLKILLSTVPSVLLRKGAR